MADLTLRGQYEEARRDLRGGHLRSALAACRRILQVFPRHVASYRLLGEIYLELGRTQRSADAFRRVLSADPEDTLAYAGLGAIYEERGALEEALWHWERAFELSPGNSEIRESLRGLYARRTVDTPARLKLDRAALARLYLRGRLYGKAAAELRGLLARETQRPDLGLALAEALWRDGQIEAATAACQRVLDVLPNCLKANLILGHIWLHTRQEDPARVLLHRAQTLDPDNVVAQRLLGARSALPPRATRLPLDGEALPPLDLPYLLTEETPAAVALPARSVSGAEPAWTWPPRHGGAPPPLAGAPLHGMSQIERALEQYTGLVTPDQPLLPQVWPIWKRWPNGCRSEVIWESCWPRPANLLVERTRR
jgi:tetratricopeptide (TPR) repeat protein